MGEKKKKKKTITAKPAENTRQIRQYKKEKFIEFFPRDEVRGNISMTCDVVGISRQGYYDWLEKDELFREKMKEAKCTTG